MQIPSKNRAIRLETNSKKATGRNCAQSNVIRSVAFAIFLLASGYSQRSLGQCNLNDLVGEWQGGISSMAHGMGTHTYVFTFKPDGTYTYRIREGQVPVTQHSGTYKLEELREPLKKSSNRLAPWLCKLTLSPNASTVKTNPDARESIIKLQKLSMLTTQEQSFRYKKLDEIRSFQDMKDARNGTDSQTFFLKPVLD